MDSLRDIRVLCKCQKLEVEPIEMKDGRSTSFWFDNWIGDDNLSQSFPKLLTIAEFKKASRNSSYVSTTQLEKGRYRSTGNP